MERFTVTRVSDKNINKTNHEVALNVSELDNARKNSRTVPASTPDRRKFSFAQLTR
mgnify:FL=1